MRGPHVVFGRRPGRRIKADKLEPKVLRLVAAGQSYRPIGRQLDISKDIVLEIVKRNPFVTIDQNGVGQLMQTAIEKGRKTRPKIKLGICGEHGGDPDSVKFCHRIGLDYVSCSPFRVPIARLAAAQAALAK